MTPDDPNPTPSPDPTTPPVVGASAAVAAPSPDDTPPGTPPGDGEGAPVSVDAGAPSAEGAKPKDGEGAQEPKPAGVSDEAWKAKKYDKVFARMKAAEEALKTRPAAEPKADEPKPQLTEDEVNRRAAALAAQQEFDRRCNETAEVARKTYPDFDSKITQLRELVLPDDPAEQAAFSRLVEATLETGEAPRLLYELGSSPEEAERLLALAAKSPVKLGMELARLAAKKGEPEPSKAPKPLTPVGARGRAGEEISPDDPARADNLSTSTWIKRRQAEIDARRKAGERIW